MSWLNVSPDSPDSLNRDFEVRPEFGSAEVPEFIQEAEEGDKQAVKAQLLAELRNEWLNDLYRN